MLFQPIHWREFYHETFCIVAVRVVDLSVVEFCPKFYPRVWTPIARDGNQSVLSVNASANQSVSIQVFGNGLTDANAVNMRFEFDANQVTYESFIAGSALPGAPALPNQGTGFCGGSLIGQVGQQRAMGCLAPLGFAPQRAFKSASIRLVRGELRGRGSRHCDNAESDHRVILYTFSGL